jgi:hypothetical protein
MYDDDESEFEEEEFDPVEDQEDNDDEFQT